MKVINGYSNYAVTYSGEVYGFRSHRFLKQSDNGEGYLRVYIQADDGAWHTQLVHRLVATAFVANPDPAVKDQVNHKDGNKYNNHGDNLEWTSCLENVHHSRENSLRDDKACRVLSDEQAYRFFKMLVTGITKKDACDMVGITVKQAHWVIHGRTYQGIREECGWDNRPFRRETLSFETVITICKMLQDGKSPKEISEMLHVPKWKVVSIKGRRSFREISESFTF